MRRVRILKSYKSGSAYLVSDTAGGKSVLKKNAPEIGVKFSKFLDTKNHPLRRYIPRHMPYGWDGFSYLREHFEGEVCGDSTYQFGFTNRAFKTLKPKEIVEVIRMLQNINQKEAFGGKLETRDSNWYLRCLVETKEALNELVGRGMYKKVQSQMSNMKSLIDKETKYLANGDLHPKNILLVDARPTPYAPDFVILDWDILHLNNPAYDLSFLYLWGWRNKLWQKRIVAAYKKENPDFEMCFKFCVAYLSSQLIKHARITLKSLIQGWEVERKTLAEKFLKVMIKEFKRVVK